MAREMAIWRWAVRKQYSIAQARDHLPGIVHAVEESGPVELTRRGKPVAVILSLSEYERLRPQREDFWEVYERLNKEFDFPSLDITPDIFPPLRDRSPGRDFSW
jgi:antitoxin Phd